MNVKKLLVKTATRPTSRS